MPLWKEPSHTYPFLDIPELQICPLHSMNSIKIALHESPMPVSLEFINIWHTPPTQMDDAYELSSRLRVIGSTLSQLLIYCRSFISVSYKDGPLDIVTNMDRGLEMLFRIWISKHYPHHKIIGEEGYKDVITENDYVWYIDPIDGTANYVNGGSDITFQTGCLYKGKPFAAYIGLPFQGKEYCVPSSRPSPSIIHSTSSPILGSEYLPSKPDQDHIFNTLLRTLNASPYKVKSIGVNILGLIENKSTLFYKSNVKLWDIIAPMIVIYFLDKNRWEFTMVIPNQTNSPFSNSTDYINYINTKHKKNCRIGLIMITPKQKPDFISTILTHYYDNYPHTRPA